MELGDIICGKYDVVYMSAQKLVQRSLWKTAIWWAPEALWARRWWPICRASPRSTPCRPTTAAPSASHSEFITGRQLTAAAPICRIRSAPCAGTQYVKDGFDIPFETFLGFGGGKVPDIDLNFSGEYQARAHRHAVEMFGETQVFRAGTIGTLADKTAYGYVKQLSGGERPGRSSRAEENRLTQGCVGVRRTTGQHPGGLVVVPDDMDDRGFLPPCSTRRMPQDSRYHHHPF